MVKLQHKRDRAPDCVLVNGRKYALDANGVIECSEEDAEKLMLGSCWRAPEHWAGKEKAIAVTMPQVPAAPDAGRRPRTKDELLAAANADGWAPEAPAPEAPAPEAPAPEAPAPEAPVGDEEQETITVSDDMTKAELLTLAEEIGIKVNRNMSKAQILEVLEKGDQSA